MGQAEGGEGGYRGRLDRIDAPEYVALRREIQTAMDKGGWKQRQVSRLLGKHHTYMNEVLGGRRAMEFLEIVDVCRALHADPAELLDRALGVGGE